MVLKSTNYFRRNRWIASMLLWLFLSYIGGISLFAHYHTINGQTIYHSHYYNGTAENPNHSHSSQQCNAITALSLYIALAAATAAMTMVLISNGTKIESYISLGTIQQSKKFYLLRAPPVFI